MAPDASSIGSAVMRRSFDDFDEMSAFMASADVELIRITAGRFDGTLLLADLGPVTINWSFHSAPVIARATAHWRGRLFLARVKPGGGPVTANGHVLDEHRLVVYRPGALQHAWTDPPGDGVELLAVTARIEDLDRVSLSSTGEKFSSGPGLCTLLQPTPASLAALRSLAVSQRAVLELQAVNGAELLRSMAEEMLKALVLAVASDVRRKIGHEWSGDFQARVVDRAEDFFRQHLGERIYLAQLCRAAGATERQLQRAFRAVYGVSPNRYVKLRRLHLARRALRNAVIGNATVGNVATRFGFQDFGRFAIAYRALFGEAPSTTLGRSRSGLT
jgi:AraC-like DNA-binding protein